MSIRQPAVAGSFYPGSETEIRRMFARMAPREAPQLHGRLRALIAPHAGWQYSGALLARAVNLVDTYRTAENIERLRIIHIGPSHHEFFTGVALSPDAQWLTPLGPVPVSTASSASPESEAMQELARPHATEHSLEVQLPMLQLLLGKFEYLPLLTGQVNPERLARQLATAVEEAEVSAEAGAQGTVILVSTDLSHFHPEAQAHYLDGISHEAIQALDTDLLEEKGELCGKAGVLALMHLARWLGWRAGLLDYATSADAGGPPSEVVGYGAYAFWG